MTRLLRQAHLAITRQPLDSLLTTLSLLVILYCFTADDFTSFCLRELGLLLPLLLAQVAIDARRDDAPHKN